MVLHTPLFNPGSFGVYISLQFVKPLATSVTIVSNQSTPTHSTPAMPDFQFPKTNAASQSGCARPSALNVLAKEQNSNFGEFLHHTSKDHAAFSNFKKGVPGIYHTTVAFKTILTFQ